jgi:hypothetical protein
MSNAHWLNNLLLGENTARPIFDINTFTNYTSSDCNGFRPNPGAACSFGWNSPPFDVVSDFLGPDHTPALVTRHFATLADDRAATGQDARSIPVDYDMFVNVPMLNAQDVNTLLHVLNAADYDFRLKPGAAAIGRGVVIPTVNEDFTGLAPDVGAIEFGTAPPHYGPRW